MKAMFSAALLGALLLTPVAAAATPIRYQINFSPTAEAPAGGTGYFFRDDVTELLSNFTWDFGGGNTGGIVDALTDWSATVFGGTISHFFFEILTQQDVHPSPCSTLTTGCSSTFETPQVVGFPSRIVFRDQSNTNAQQYILGLGGSPGSFSTQLAPRVAPEPGTLALLALGMCGARAYARRRRAI